MVKKFKIALVDSSTSFELSGDLLEPIGICYLSAYLSQHGFQTNVFHQIHESNKNIADRIISWGPDIVCISFMTNATYQATELAQIIKKKSGCTIIAGGVHVSFDTSVLKTGFFDYIVRGEGETPLLNLCQALSEGRSPDSLPDILHKPGLTWVDIEHEKLISDINRLPFPDRQHLPMDQYGYYKLFDLLPEEQRIASIQASRGCNHSCTFCTSPHLWLHRMRYRTKESLAEEIDYLEDKYKINVLNFRDENFSNDLNFLKIICDLMEGRGILWYSFARIDELTPSILERMKNSGCVELFLGVESGHNGTLNQINKEIMVEQIVETCNEVYKAGIRNSIFIMIGFPWETEATLQQTRDLILSLPYQWVRIAIATPFPGTVFYKNTLKNDLFTTDDLSLFDTEHLVIKTKVSSQRLMTFRKQLMRELYLSDNYRKRCEEDMKKNPKMKKPYQRWFSYIKKTLR